MIGYVKGPITHLGVDYCFVDVQGVGYRVFIPSSSRQKLVIGSAVTLYTYLHVREDALLLYGFYTQDEYDLFLLLMDVSGIGPKAALNILSTITPNSFRTAISQKNIGVLTKIPGIGKKTAERIILELKDKVASVEGDNDASDNSFITTTGGTGDVAQQALEAMMALGYSQAEVMPVLSKVKKEASSIEELIKLALREFTRR